MTLEEKISQINSLGREAQQGLLYSDILEKHIALSSEKLNKKIEQRKNFLTKNNYITDLGEITESGIIWLANRI